ncbi:uncharacterized protein N7511_000825 [Penicillium nucicola]|uniref:uncharacterized protein n=1 Tax=Penicillium nucicola TaxID=1850975 RepID=UPI002544EECC|nr:uncharacterized protein N7511_000825 [Penicillium nucicola]KAJ5775814.1 hypothetical protein N7511_000825 [Penicillium nucicola]
MLLTSRLIVDSAASYTNDLDFQPQTLQSATISYPSGFSLFTLLLLLAFYARPKQLGGPVQSSGMRSSLAMGAIEPVSSEERLSALPCIPDRSRAASSQRTSKALRSKTLYQLAYPPDYARHKRLKLGSKLLLQLQQISGTPRLLPILDILPASIHILKAFRKFLAVFPGKHGLCPDNLIIVMNERYDRGVSTISGNHLSSKDENEYKRHVVATICQLLRGCSQMKGQAKICLKSGAVWEGTPLPSGSYEFISHTDNGVKVMRWVLRSSKHRKMPATLELQPREDNKRFTFSSLDPTTRRHPVIASMTCNQLEVQDQYCSILETSTAVMTPSLGRSIIHDASYGRDTSKDRNTVTLDDGLRTLIIITGIYVAFCEGWLQNFS